MEKAKAKKGMYQILALYILKIHFRGVHSDQIHYDSRMMNFMLNTSPLKRAF